MSVEVEVHFDGDLDPDRMPIFHGRLEFPVLDRFNRLLVEAHAQAAQHANVASNFQRGVKRLPVAWTAA